MHLRTRHIIDIINKKARMLPLVGVLGPRQVGKSTLLRDLLAKERSIPYFTLDRPEILREVRSKPEAFVLHHSEDFSTPIIIDEAHKVPQLFDVLKVLADERRTRGLIYLTGSLDFSHAAGVRETLTGRIGIARLYPMTISELANRPFMQSWNRSSRTPSKSAATSREIEIWIERGGMPAICKFSDSNERGTLITEWLQSVCYRDLTQLRGSRYDGAVALEILELIARNPEYSQADFARQLGIDSRLIGKYLRALEALYVIYRIPPYKARRGSGSDRFYIFDAGVAAHLGASKKNRYTILLINEIRAQTEYSGSTRADIYFYALRGSTKFDLLVKVGEKLHPILVSERAEIDPYTRRSLMSLAKDPNFDNIQVAAPVVNQFKLAAGVVVRPLVDYV
jgi:predicted AAA+ superfamily ATPase